MVVTSQEVTYYMIDRSRGSPALRRFFNKECAGVLVTDFWGVYNAIVCTKKQKFLPHLMRDLKRPSITTSPVVTGRQCPQNGSG